MNISLLSMDGFLMILRWLHFFFGIAWIGHLYYFNFVQGLFFAETDATTKSNAIQKLVPKALWWFRWGAMWTLATGLLILMIRGHQSGFALFATGWGITILTGMALGFCMWFNVWFVIWPAQKLLIQSTTQVASGGAAIPEAAAKVARAGIASRTNTMFSIALLFFMGAASHLPLMVNPDTSLIPLVVVLAAIIGGLELNALKGKMGPMASVKGVVHMGVLLTIVLYAVIEILTK